MQLLDEFLDVVSGPGPRVIKGFSEKELQKGI